MIIYMATNKINGKSYVGQTVRPLSQRVSCHVSNAINKGDNMYFHHAIRKYSKENFTWEILQECDTIEELNKLEIYYISLYNTFENGYNLTSGGKGCAGKKRSGKKSYWYGRKHTEETKKKMSETRIKNGKSKGKNNPRAKAIIINNRHFDTIKEAAQFLKVIRSTIRSRLKNNWIGYEYSGKDRGGRIIMGFLKSELKMDKEKKIEDYEEEFDQANKDLRDEILNTCGVHKSNFGCTDKVDNLDPLVILHFKTILLLRAAGWSEKEIDIVLKGVE